MNSETKITLSDEELELVTDTGFILTKRGIIEKVYALFGYLASQYSDSLQNNKALPAEVLGISPKIAKGENYLLLPYVVLDHPRLYEKGNILAVRTMFWWGNFFSITLHLSGSYKNIFQQRIGKNISALADKDLYICINKDQWQHHFEADNYVLLKNKNAVEIQEIISQQHFIKLSLKFRLDQWGQMQERLAAAFESMMTLIRN